MGEPEVDDVGFDPKAELLEQWNGHRNLTLWVARAFPPDKLCTYAPVGPLRTFGAMLDEIARIEQAYMRGLAEDRWSYDPQDPPAPADAAAAVAFVEEAHAYTRSVWDRLPADMLLAPRKDPFFFGDAKRPYDWLVYCVENEIHHRGQGYIYLRELGVEPPPFYVR